MINKDIIKKIFNIFSRKIKEDIKLNDSSNDGPSNYNTLKFLNTKDEDIMSLVDKKDIFKTLLSTKNLYENEKAYTTVKMHSDCLEIHRILIPLIKLNIDHRITLVGGSIRDFLHNNHKDIKDLDMLISFEVADKYESNYQYSRNVLSKSNILYMNICTNEELEAFNYKEHDDSSIKINKIIEILISKEYKNNSTTIFTKDERSTGEPGYGGDILTPVSGIIKLEDKKFNYPLDIIITDHYIEGFMCNIDFGLCNVGLKIISKEDGKTKIHDFKNIRNDFLITEEFLKDYKNKTLTLNPVGENARQIDLSLNNRLGKLKNKYPSYELVIPEDISEGQKKIINSIMTHKEMNEKLAPKDLQEKPVKRRKI